MSFAAAVRAALVADAFWTSRKFEPPCWLVMRRIFADPVPPFFPVDPESGFPSSWLRFAFEGGIVAVRYPGIENGSSRRRGDLGSRKFVEFA